GVQPTTRRPISNRPQDSIPGFHPAPQDQPNSTTSGGLLPYELLDRRQRFLHATQVLLKGRIVVRAHRQRGRPLLAVQPFWGIADLVRNRDARSGQLSLSLGQTRPVQGGAPHYRAVALHKIHLTGGWRRGRV